MTGDQTETASQERDIQAADTQKGRVDPVTGEALPTAEAAPDAPSEPSFEASPEPSSDPLLPPIKEEIAALLKDGKTYAEAELAFQKTRLSFAADRGKSALLYTLLALGFVHLMLIALVVGALIALAPLVGGWAATGIVVAALLLAVTGCVLVIRAKIRAVTRAFEKPER